MKKPLFLSFKQYQNLIVAISERKDGSMKAVSVFEGAKRIGRNRINFLNKFKIDISSVVSADLVHGNKVRIVGKEDGGGLIPDTDALLTSERNLFLSVTVADCLPIFVYDRRKGIVGIIHCGWRSLAKNIIEAVIKELTSNFKSNSKDIIVGMGPAVCVEHFEIGKDIANRFRSLPRAIFLRKDKKMFLDLKEAAAVQCQQLGIERKNIEIGPECTFCLNKKYFSYRREKSVPVKAMMAIIGMKS